MPSLNRNQGVTGENCSTQTTKFNRARHKKSHSAGTLYFIQCISFSTKSQNDLNSHIVRMYRAQKLEVTFKCKLCYQELPGFYAVRQQKRS